jgi:RNA polymerase sigma factor (sigma-70 family)
MDEQELQRLYLRYDSGDDGAGDQLAGALRPRIWVMVIYTGFSDADADDLTQDALLRVLRTRGGHARFDPERGQSFLAWARAIVRNMVRDFWRRRANRVPQAPLEEEPASPAGSGCDEVDDLEERDARRRALRSWLPSPPSWCRGRPLSCFSSRSPRRRRAQHGPRRLPWTCMSSCP